MENENLRTRDHNICNEMKDSFLDYAMSVIVSRALPDVRDGLKPVHRRILYAMDQISNHADKPYQKSARTVGEVIGKYHPHGDASVYGTMVRMAQDFSYRYVLIDGHGNFGSIDGDNAAAMRYTEARMSKLAMLMLKDINKKTVRFKENYDGRELEPVVMPSKFPNLLVNGSTGIAVGMATNIAPHNLVEVIDGVIALSQNSEITLSELMKIIKGPDYPTGGIILGLAGIEKAYIEGKGSIITRSKTEIKELNNGKKQIIITEIPYQINKSKLIEAIVGLIREKIIEGITDIRDETNRKGLRVVIELRRDTVAEVILNKLFKMTSLQTAFSYNNIVLVDGEPQRLSLKETLSVYLQHQISIIRKRTQFDLDKSKDRVHILNGLQIALDNIDKIIELIKKAPNIEIAKNALIENYQLSEIQAKAILEMKLARLTGLERDKISSEINDQNDLIVKFEMILANPQKVLDIIIEELTAIKNKFGDNRKTVIDETAIISIEDEDLIPQENVVITLSKTGYVKRIPASTYRSQNRGGKGIKGQTTLEEDYVQKMLYSTTHTDLMFFTNFGKVYRLRVYEIPQFSRQSKGIPIINLINIEKNEKVKAIISNHQYGENDFFVFATKNGLVKKTRCNQYLKIRQTGKIALVLRENDELLDVVKTSGFDEIILGNTNGKSIRFGEKDIRASGRVSSGVKGMNIGDGEVISISLPTQYKYLLSVSTRGIGKLTPIEDYRKIKRGGKGVKTIKINQKTGKLVEVVSLDGYEELLLITNRGQIIRLRVPEISISSRNTQGVKLMNIDDKIRISSVVAIREHNELEKNTSDNINLENKIDTVIKNLDNTHSSH